MKIRLIVLGKTKDSYLKEGIYHYLDRLKHYCNFSYEELTISKSNSNLPTEKRREMEVELVLNKIENTEQLFLLDDKGKSYSSVAFANFIQQRLVAGGKGLVFVAGGPYGFARSIEQKASGKISLSKMTFTHDMVRLIFVEQVYRGFTILKGEKYHHE